MASLEKVMALSILFHSRVDIWNSISGFPAVLVGPGKEISKPLIDAGNNSRNVTGNQSYQIISSEVAKSFLKMPNSEIWQENSLNISNLAENSPKHLQIGG